MLNKSNNKRRNEKLKDIHKEKPPWGGLGKWVGEGGGGMKRDGTRGKNFMRETETRVHNLLSPPTTLSNKTQTLLTIKNSIYEEVFRD